MNVAATTADMDTGAEDSAEQGMQSIAGAMEDASKAATEHATNLKNTIVEAGPRAMRSVSRFSYTSAYALSYGIVYAAVFVAQSLPQENSIMYGFRDGARAAMDLFKAA